MEKQDIFSTALHEVPDNFKNAILASQNALKTWENITKIARNEWVCFITSAKKDETKQKRLNQAIENLSSGKKRPCCFPGCPHRNPNTSKWFK